MNKHDKPNIVLIGMSGAGKSTVGMALSYKLKMPFVDMDNYIAQKENMTIPDIFQTYGSEYFRDLETAAAERIGLHYRNTIVSSGGGVVLRPENMQYLKKHGVVIYINRSVDHILSTLKTENRPLLKDNPERLYAMYEERHSLYLKYADVVVANYADFKSGVENVYDAIKNLLNKQ